MKYGHSPAEIGIKISSPLINYNITHLITKKIFYLSCLSNAMYMCVVFIMQDIYSIPCVSFSQLKYQNVLWTYLKRATTITGTPLLFFQDDGTKIPHKFYLPVYNKTKLVN